MPKPADAVAALLTERRYNKRSIEAYVHWVHRLESHFASKQVRSISPKDLASFFRHLQTQVADQSVRQAATAIRFMYREVFGKRDLAEVVPKIKENRRRAVIPGQPEVLATIAEVDEPTVALLLKCVYGMGLELKEACTLKWNDFDFKTYRVKVQPQRTRGSRSIPIPQFVLSDLKSSLAGKPKSQFVFTSSTGDRIGEQTVQRAWARARARTAGAQKVDIRSLRHAYILHLVQLGVPIRDVLHDMGMHKARPMEFYSQYAGPALPLTFSPADRALTEAVDSKSNTAATYGSEARIFQLAAIKSREFDFTRLIALLHELNAAARSNNYLSVAFLVRAVIDHVPPIFGFRYFVEVSNNYGATASLRRHMEHLQKSLRNVADAYLHETIRSQEDLPQLPQVDFRSAVDHVLGEVVRVLKKREI